MCKHACTDNWWVGGALFQHKHIWHNFISIYKPARPSSIPNHSRALLAAILSLLAAFSIFVALNRRIYIASASWYLKLKALKTTHSSYTSTQNSRLKSAKVKLAKVTMATGLISSIRWAPEEGRTENSGRGRKCCHRVCSYTVASMCNVITYILGIRLLHRERLVPRRLHVLVRTCSTVIGRDEQYWHFPWQFLPRQILQLLLWWSLRVSSDCRSQWHCTSLSMTSGMQMVAIIKLSANYNMVSIHPMISYSRFIWWEKSFVNFMFLWQIVKVLSTNTIRNWFWTLRHPWHLVNPYRLLITALFAHFQCTASTIRLPTRTRQILDGIVESCADLQE